MAESPWGGQAKALFAEAREPSRLARAVVTFYRRIDDVIDASVRGHAVPIACRSGCSYCCHLRLEVQPHEAFVLAEWLRRNFTIPRLDALIERLRANVAKTTAAGVEGRKRMNLACALLDDAGRCSAYEARPAQCRRYHSMRVETCKSFFDHPGDESIETPMHPAVAHNAAVLITQTQHAVRDAKLDASNVDFNFALLEALDNPKAWRRWKDGKKAFVRQG